MRSDSVAFGSPSRVSAGPARARTRVLEGVVGGTVVEETVEPTQRDDDRLPDGVVAFVGEPFEELEHLTGFDPAGDRSRPGIVDEVVSLQRRQVRQRVRAESAAQRVVVVDAVETAPAGIDDDGTVRVGQGRDRLGFVEEHGGGRAGIADLDRNRPVLLVRRRVPSRRT